MAPVIVFVGRAALVAAVGYGAKRAMAAYNRNEKRKSLSRCKDKVRAAHRQHKNGLDKVHSRHGHRLSPDIKARLKSLRQRSTQ